jgi:alginate O-acetyltransferase complex protein AlgI
MIFNSVSYFIFLPVVFIVYYLLPDRSRWILLLLASIFFYSIGGVPTIFVPVFIILSTFMFGILIDRTADVHKKHIYYLMGIVINLGLLVFFKCINFFIATVVEGYYLVKPLFHTERIVDHSSYVIKIIIPLGISYITFQAIGYLIEIKRGNQTSEKDLGL